MNETQATQDLIENGAVHRPGCYAPTPRAMREPSSKCCDTPLVRQSAVAYRCISCARLFTAAQLRSLGIDPERIG